MLEALAFQGAAVCNRRGRLESARPCGMGGAYKAPLLVGWPETARSPFG